MNLKVVNSNQLTFTGAEALSYSDLTGWSIVSSEGTATPLIVGNTIEFTGGTLTDLVLSDGANNHRYSISEGKGLTLYDRIGTANLTLSADVWSFGNGRTDNNLDGCDVWVNDTDSEKLFVPLQEDGTSIKGSSDTITGYTWSYKVEPCATRGGGFANVESKLEAYTSTDLLALEAWLNTNGYSYFWTSDGTTLSQKAFSEIPLNHEDSYAIMSKQVNSNLITDVITMKGSFMPLSVSEKNILDSYLNQS